MKNIWNNREAFASVFMGEIMTLILVVGIFYISKYIGGILGYLFTTIFELVSIILFSFFIYKNGKRINVLSQMYELNFGKMVVGIQTIVLFSSPVLLVFLEKTFNTKNILNIISLGVTLFLA